MGGRCGASRTDAPTSVMLRITTSTDAAASIGHSSGQTTDAAVRHGLGAALAGRLAAETMAGTASLLEARGYDTLTVRREVTSPGGITAHHAPWLIAAR